MTVKDIYDFLDSFAPFDTQADWDNSGLLVGSLCSQVKKAVVTLDVSLKEIEQAEKAGAQLIVSHHPVIFRPQKTFLDGGVCFAAAQRGISIISAHTNLDKAVNGVNDALCERLELDYKKLPEADCGGFLNIGSLRCPKNARQLALFIKERLGGAVSFCDGGRDIVRAAVCSGAGGDFAEAALRLGCDALITGEASYHDFVDAKNAGLSLFAAGHFETEAIIAEHLVSVLSSAFNDIEFIASEQISPITAVI